MNIDYELKNGKVIRIPEKTLENLEKNLDISREDAIQVYLEDEGYEVNEEQEALTKKAKENRITATIHKAEGKTRKKRVVERKANPDKEELIAEMAAFLDSKAGVENVVVENVGKIITFNFNGKAMKLDLIEKRVKK